MATILSKTFEIRIRSPDFEWSGFQMVGTTAMAVAKAQPLKKLEQLISNIQKAQILNVSGFQMVGFSDAHCIGS